MSSDRIIRGGTHTADLRENMAFSGLYRKDIILVEALPLRRPNTE
jgi:hypothetical protein